MSVHAGLGFPNRAQPTMLSKLHLLNPLVSQIPLASRIRLPARMLRSAHCKSVFQTTKSSRMLVFTSVPDQRPDTTILIKAGETMTRISHQTAEPYITRNKPTNLGLGQKQKGVHRLWSHRLRNPTLSIIHFLFPMHVSMSGYVRHYL